MNCYHCGHIIQVYNYQCPGCFRATTEGERKQAKLDSDELQRKVLQQRLAGRKKPIDELIQQARAAIAKATL